MLLLLHRLLGGLGSHLAADFSGVVFGLHFALSGVRELLAVYHWHIIFPFS